MLKWIAILIALLASNVMAAEMVKNENINPAVEIRAIWINADAIPKTDEGIRQLVQKYNQANINVLFPEVIARGYCAYPTKLLARDPRFEGAVDPLPPMIDEAHKLGMEVHPWVWVFRAGYTKDKGAILTAHPDWVMLSKYGEELSANGGLWISPDISAAKDFMASLFAELVSKYNIDGLHLDYIRYEVQSPTPYGYNPSARCEFARQYGIDPTKIDRLSTDQILWNKFRERQVNSFVQRISKQTRSIKPNIKISAAVGSDPVTARLNLLQNWPNWIDNGWVDFITPMAYTTNDATFTRLVSDQICAAGGKTIVVPGIGLHMQKDKPEQTACQIEITRKLGTGGQALFASSYYTDALTSTLKQGPYKNAAVLPNICQRKDAAYVPPTDPPIIIPENIIPLPELNFTKTDRPVIVDGNLDDAAWAAAGKVQLAYDSEGNSAPVDTTALLTYDEQNLYVAFQASELMMDKLKSAITKRDGPTFYDDSVEIFVDPTNERRSYYHLSTNTLGTQFDQKVFSPSWNSEWKSAAEKGSCGYDVEISIPFASLGVKTPTPGTKWAINLTRNRTTTGTMEFLTWAVPYGTFHSPDRLGTVVF